MKLRWLGKCQFNNCLNWRHFFSIFCRKRIEVDDFYTDLMHMLQVLSQINPIWNCTHTEDLCFMRLNWQRKLPYKINGDFNSWFEIYDMSLDIGFCGITYREWFILSSKIQYFDDLYSQGNIHLEKYEFYLGKTVP